MHRPAQHSRYDAFFPEEQGLNGSGGADWDYTVHDDWDSNNIDKALFERLDQLPLFRPSAEEGEQMRRRHEPKQKSPTAFVSDSTISIFRTVSCAGFDEAIGGCVAKDGVVHPNTIVGPTVDETPRSRSDPLGTIPTLATFTTSPRRRRKQQNEGLDSTRNTSVDASPAEEIVQTYGCGPALSQEQHPLIEQPPADANDNNKRTKSSSPVSVTTDSALDPSQISSASEASDDDGDETSMDSELWELQQELSVLKRLASASTCSTPTTCSSPQRPSLEPLAYAQSWKTVRFTHPVVTAVKHRPRTAAEELPVLYWGVDELLQLEMDRESRVFNERVELVMSGGIQEGMRVSVSYPKPTRILSAAAFRRKDSGVAGQRNS